MEGLVLDALAGEDRETTLTPDAVLEIRAWLRLLTCTTMIERHIRTLLTKRFETTLPRFDALAQLERCPDGLTMGQLSRRMMVSNGNVTGVVDRLAEDGLVERIAIPGDRRANRVRLTIKGRKIFGRMTPAHHAHVHAMLADVVPADLETLHALLGTLKASILAAEERGTLDHESETR